MSFDDDNRDADFRKLPAAPSRRVGHGRQVSAAQVLGTHAQDRAPPVASVELDDQAEDHAVAEGEEAGQHGR